MILLKLFLIFFKIGIFTFGGGHAMIPLIESEMLANGWIDEEMLTQLIAVSESTPGPFAINIATFIGSTVSGAELGAGYSILGSLCATLGVVTPSLLIILLIASLFQTFSSNKYIRKIIEGINPIIIGMILSTGLWFLFSSIFAPKGIVSNDVVKVTSFDCVSLILFIALYVLYKLTKGKLHPAFLILIAGVCGAVIYTFYEPIQLTRAMNINRISSLINKFI